MVASPARERAGAVPVKYHLLANISVLSEFRSMNFLTSNEWLNQATIEVLELPSHSPDLNNTEDYQKLVDRYHQHLIEVKMAEGHLNNYSNYCMYIVYPANLVTFSEDL